MGFWQLSPEHPIPRLNGALRTPDSLPTYLPWFGLPIFLAIFTNCTIPEYTPVV